MSATTQQPDWQSSLSSDATEVTLQVTPDNVLSVRKVLLEEADRLIRSAKPTATPVVGLCGGDPLSRDAQAAFNDRIERLLRTCAQHGNELKSAGAALAATARHYGYTEEQIEASLRSIDLGDQA